MAYTKPQQRKKEESERQRRERGDQIKFITTHPVIEKVFFFSWFMLRKGHGDLYKAPTKEERRKRAAKRIE